jgi:hypothetical protein
MTQILPILFPVPHPTRQPGLPPAGLLISFPRGAKTSPQSRSIDPKNSSNRIPKFVHGFLHPRAENGMFQNLHWSLCTVPHPHLLDFFMVSPPNSHYGGFDWDIWTVPHLEMAGVLSFLGENRHSWRFDYNLCTVLYFEHIGEGLKAVFDAAESPLQAALPQG